MSYKSLCARENITEVEASKLQSIKTSGARNGFYGKKHKPETLSKMAQVNANRAKQISKPELIVWGMLHALDIPFKFQIPIDRYIIDFVINDKLLIEVFGNYYHDEKMSPSNKKRDETKLQYCRDHNLDVLVLWESEIVNHPKMIIQRLLNAYQNHQTN